MSYERQLLAPSPPNGPSFGGEAARSAERAALGEGAKIRTRLSGVAHRKASPLTLPSPPSRSDGGEGSSARVRVALASVLALTLLLVANACLAAMNGEDREVRQRVVRTPATRADDVDLPRAVLNRKGDRFFEVGGVEASRAMKAVRRDLGAHFVIDGVEIPYHRVGHKPRVEGMAGASVRGDDHVDAAGQGAE